MNLFSYLTSKFHIVARVQCNFFSRQRAYYEEIKISCIRMKEILPYPPCFWQSYFELTHEQVDESNYKATLEE